MFLKVYADDKLIKTETQKPAADNAYAFTVKLKAGLIKYQVEFGTKTGGTETVLQTVGNLVCGDAYLIDGQSNALAMDTGEKSPNDTSEWIRSYGGPTGRGDATDWGGNGKRPNLWSCPAWRPEKGRKRLTRLVGHGACQTARGKREDADLHHSSSRGRHPHRRAQAQRTNRGDLNNVRPHALAGATGPVDARYSRRALAPRRSDQGSDGPDGGYGWETYQQYFINMSAAWKQDLPNIRHYYVFQIWPNGCSKGNGHGDMLREEQRTLPRLYSNMDVMSTLGIKPPGPCHYPLTGWAEFARLMQPLIERDFYGQSARAVTAPDLKRAYYTSSAKDAIILEFDQPVVWSDKLASQFYLDGADQVAKGTSPGTWSRSS